MITVDEALKHVLDLAIPRRPLNWPIKGVTSLVLAEDVASDIDSPPHDKSMVDGYAVVASDLSGGTAELEVLEEVTAGEVPRETVRPGTATRIMTGAPIPAGADAVVMVEQTELIDPTRVRIAADRVVAHQHILDRGTSMRRGDVVLKRGTEIRPSDVGLLCEVGRTEVAVILAPMLAVISTGNELVPAEEVPTAGKIRNSNGPMLTAAAQLAGADAVDLGIARDERAPLARHIAEGLKSDILLLSGGVSAGVLDLVPGVLAELGVEQVFHKVRLKPGKPLWFGVKREPKANVLVFGLPGNPVSGLVCFELFVRPAIARLAGRAPRRDGPRKARLTTAFEHRGDRPTYHPAVYAEGENGPEIHPINWHGSADLASLASANALAVFPAGNRAYSAGEVIEMIKT